MRFASLALLVSASAVGAQSLEILPVGQLFTTRGSLDPNAGELTQGFHSSHWRAIGSSGTRSTIRGVRHVMQDEESATQDPYRISVRIGSDAAGPTPGNPGILCHVGPLVMPVGQGRIAYLLTTTFQQPCVVPTGDFFSAGVVLGTAPQWASDGLSVHMAFANVQSGPQRQDHGWEFVAGQAAFAHPLPARSWRIALLTDTPILQNGTFESGTASYSRGMGGMFPPNLTHGWSTHLDGGPAFGLGIARVLLSTNVQQQPLVAPFIAGAIYLGADAIPIATLFLDRDGQSDLKVVDPIRRFGLTAWVQAILLDNALTRAAATNANASTFQ